MIPFAEAGRRAIEQMIDELEELRDVRLRCGDQLGADNLQRDIAALEQLLLPQIH